MRTRGRSRSERFGEERAAGPLTSGSRRRILCKSKIHRATLTGADLHYERSLTVDRDLMDAADLVIVISYGDYDDELDDAFTPRIVFVDAHNRRVPPASRAEFDGGRHEA